MFAFRLRTVASVCALLAAVALLAALAGCGGSDSASGSDAPTSSPAPVPAPPQVAVQDDRIAVIDPARLAERAQLIADTGASATRIDLFWRDVAPTEPADPTDPADPAYAFARYDAVLADLAERGIPAMLSVYNGPEWATGGTFTEGINAVINAQAPDPAAYGAFMQALAARYSGEFTADGVTLPAVELFEVWNEGNLSGFLSPQTANGERVVLDTYAEMTRAAYSGIKDANPDATVIAGVTGPRGRSSDTATGVEDWIAGLAERDAPLDAYSQHVYPVAAPTVPTEAFPAWSTLDRLEAAVDGIRPNLPIYITEAGYTTTETPYRDAAATATLEEQARYVEEIYTLPAVQTGRYPMIVWFNLQDNPGWPAGLLDIDGNPKPSYEAFVALNG
jgi:hypothetical protein